MEREEQQEEGTRGSLSMRGPWFLAFTMVLALCQFANSSKGTKSLLESLVGRDLNELSAKPVVIMRHSETPLPPLKGARKTKKSYNFTTAICSMVKDGEAYFEEWLDYHIGAMEFDNIYLYDNSLMFELEHWYLHTRDHPIYSKVEIIHDPAKDQALLMGKCVEQFGNSPKGPHHDYIALIDVDEFLVIPGYPNNIYTGIHGILQDYLVPYGGALTVNWMLVGTANRTVYAPLPVLKRFQYRENVTNPVIKTIVKSSDFVKLKNPHSAGLRKERYTHTTLQPGYRINCRNSRCANDMDRPSDILLLHHFRYTSEKEYLFKKCNRGRPNAEKSWCTENGTLREDTPPHIQMRPGTVFDDGPWKFFTEKVPKYKAYDQFEDYH